MKKMFFALMTMLTISISAKAMSYEQARNEALFLTDKMAYELNLTDEQYEAAYEINLDYLMGVTSYDNVYGPYWERRNLDLSYILYQWQWDLYRAASYFYRPLYWEAGHWHFGIYIHYPRRDYFYFGRPHFYATYRGGHSWRHNGGRSWYEGRHDHFRPVAHRDHHVGMRNGWDRGDYRNNGGRSSTRITERNGQNHRFDNGRSRNDDRHQFENRNRNDNRNLNENRNRSDNRSMNENRGTGRSGSFSGGGNFGSSRSNSGSREIGSSRSNSGSREIGSSRSNGGSHSSGSMTRGSSDRGSRSDNGGGSRHGGGRR